MKAESNKTNIIIEIRLVQSLLKLDVSDFNELKKLTTDELMIKLKELRKQYKNK